MVEANINVQAPGKLILLGEYAVLEKAPALVAAINKQCKVRIKPHANHFQFSAPNLNLNNILFVLSERGDACFKEEYPPEVHKKLGFVLSIMKYVTEHSGHTIPPAAISVDTGDFYHPSSGKKFGLGSSAALTVGLMVALNEHLGYQDWMRSLYYEALLAHRTAQGKLGSGVDVAATTTGGVIRYEMPHSAIGKPETIKHCAWPSDLYMVPIWTGISASTRSFVKRVDKFQVDSPKSYRHILDVMIELSEQGTNYFEEGATQSFLDVVQAFMTQECLLGQQSGAPIISPVHKQLADLVQQTGGVYKPSGAGGGDIGVALCSSENTRRQIIEQIDSSDFEIINLSPQLEGVKCTHTYEID
jgi:phosphomevalonate kinase